MKLNFVTGDDNQYTRDFVLCINETYGKLIGYLYPSDIRAKKKPPSKKTVKFLLPDQDSNLDKLNQNQLYCHYTIGQCAFVKAAAKISSQIDCAKGFSIWLPSLTIKFRRSD